MEKEQKKDKKNKKGKNKYNFFYYNTLFKLVINLFKKKYKPVLDGKAIEELDKPCLIFANHGLSSSSMAFPSSTGLYFFLKRLITNLNKVL